MVKVLNDDEILNDPTITGLYLGAHGLRRPKSK